LVDLTETPDLIKNNTNFKYMIHVIDHYSKYLFGNLLKNKEADTVLQVLNNIFLMTGFPKELGADNGKEFHNHKYSNYLKDKNIKEIHGIAGNPHSQGVVERVHQTIKKDIISKILEKGNYNYKNIENDYKECIFAYNNFPHSSTNNTPTFLFYNNNNEITEQVHENCKCKFQTINRNAKIYKIGTKVLLNPKIIKSGNTLNKNRVTKGKILFRIPCEIIRI